MIHFAKQVTLKSILFVICQTSPELYSLYFDMTNQNGNIATPTPKKKTLRIKYTR
jgi:hypothetical protein